MKYRIRCGDSYFYGIRWREGEAIQNWKKEFCFIDPLEMDIDEAKSTLATLLEVGKFTEMPVIEEVEE